LAFGLRQRHVVVTAYVVTLFATGLGMFMLFTEDAQTIVVFICILFLLLLVFRAVGSVRLHETIDGFKRKHEISNQKKQELENFENIELHFRQARIFNQWWRAVCFAADKMDFASSSLPLTNRDGTKRELVWERDTEDINPDEMVKMIMPVRDRRSGPPLNLEVKVHANGSLESATRRLSLLSRLLEEYSVENLTS
jgi:membrane protein implicated in regulation of membrane protease activity